MPAAFVFDAYGTLFDVHSAAGRLKDAIGPHAARLSEIWRAKHLEYTWVLSLAGRQATFRALAEQSLDTAIAMAGGIAPGMRERLLDGYLTLDAYPEVARVLGALRERGSRLAILSNGDPDMLAAAVASAGLHGLLDAVLSASAAQIFKPSARVYALATSRLGLQPGQIVFVSSNRWDVAGARACGFETVWINRMSGPDEYPDLSPGAVAANLDALLELPPHG